MESKRSGKRFKNTEDNTNKHVRAENGGGGGEHSHSFQFQLSIIYIYMDIYPIKPAEAG